MVWHIWNIVLLAWDGEIITFKRHKLHNEISISLYSSSSDREGMFFYHPLHVGLMQWNGTLETLMT